MAVIPVSALAISPPSPFDHPQELNPLQIQSETSSHSHPVSKDTNTHQPSAPQPPGLVLVRTFEVGHFSGATWDSQAPQT